jgi:K(+)-stimulated pyrophosphate-energized sodium pump
MIQIAYIFGLSVLSILIAALLARSIRKKEAGTERMKVISGFIREGAMAFLQREGKAIAFYVIIITIILTLAINTKTAIAFVVGACSSALAGYVGMRTATTANVRTAHAAKSSFSAALNIAFNSGMVMGLSVVGFALLGITILFNVFNDPRILFGFSFGASSIALFARVGGGIFTKAADVGADLVGKVEKGIPEDDPRNPAVIADNVGDNVCDVAGMGADLYASFAGSIIAAMALGQAFGNAGTLLPLYVGGAGIIAAIIGRLFVKTSNEKNIHRALTTGLLVASALVIVCSYYLVRTMMPNLNAFWSIVVGLITGLIISQITEYYTSHHHAPVQRIANASKTGAATNVIHGLSVGMQSTALPIFAIGLAILITYNLDGFFGIAIAAVGMLSTLGISLAIDGFGPVADNAGGIAEMAKLDKKVRDVTDALDSVGNSTAAIGKGFAIGSAVLTALAFFSVFATEIGFDKLVLNNSNLLVGLFFGGALPFLFSSFILVAVGDAAFKIVEEVRRQFKNDGIMTGKVKPDYKQCVDIATSAALKRMIAPALITVLAPIIIGFSMGVEALAGLLIGNLVSGVAMAVFQANAGGAWDNAKKWIESGKLGGKGSAVHKAAVVGDTIGDPFKDSSGPSINILIKLMGVTALVFLPLFL